MCDTIISGTTNMGRRLSGNDRSGAIDLQSINPTRKALKATKRMSKRPNAFHASNGNVEAVSAPNPFGAENRVY